MYELRDISTLSPDPANPRKPDPVRLHLLRLSLSKLGFLLPIAITDDGLVLSGHQRLTVAKELGYVEVPVQVVSIPQSKIRGINVSFNRVTNDFGALDSGSEALRSLNLTTIVKEAETLDDVSTSELGLPHIRSILDLGKDVADRYDKKAIIIAENFIRLHIEIPIVISASGGIVNGIHRLFAARENGIEEWPVIVVDDDVAKFADHFLNYLSMDYEVDNEFADLLRYSAYRRPQNNRGSVPKAYRFWGNGERTLPDKDSYTRGYWRHFRDLHGRSILDFGAGLGKVAPFLNEKGFDCIDFEPYRIPPDAEEKKPDPDYSRKKIVEFLQTISNPDKRFDSIFLASVLNSVPFPKDRIAVLLIVHALSSVKTCIYGTCRDLSDFHYSYGGIRQANYFVFDSEPGVRLGDAVANPKIQKFMTPDQLKTLTGMLWTDTKTYPGGNIFYFKSQYPKKVSIAALSQALELEFERLPYSDGTVLGLGELAIESFSNRLGVTIPRLPKVKADRLFSMSGDSDAARV